MNKKNEITAVVYPLSNEHISRFINGKKRVFIKFLSTENIPKRIKPGIKMLFNETVTGRGIVAEAEMNVVEMMLPSQVMKQYGEDVFISSKELKDYAKWRENKKMLVLQLGEVIEYKTPKKPPRIVSLSGLYLDNEEYQFILSS